MAVTIENPIINSAYAEPTRHFRFDDEGITDEIVEARRPSSYFVPIPAARRRGGQLAFDTEWTKDRVQENARVNRIRDLVIHWRKLGHPGITVATRRLLEYWSDPERENRLFFCQIEAAETAIYLTEVAPKLNPWLVTELKEDADRYNRGLFRVAMKMATGTGKTVVMAMLIAWQTLNKMSNPQDARFTDAFLVVTPGITIRDRLRVLFPSDPGNYYEERDLVPSDLFGQLLRARIVVTNFHAFLSKESALGKASKLTKELLANGGSNPFEETPAQVVNRVCRDLGSKRQIIVLNDEAHHCYRHKPEEDEGNDAKLAGEDLREAKIREEEARVWITGLGWVAERIGIKTVYDLSATPFFLRGSGYPEGTLYPWVVSDFSLIDAIESGVVKIPRVPVDDNAMSGTTVTYRDLWSRIRKELPRRGRRRREGDEQPVDLPIESVPFERKFPAELEGALHSLYANYEKSYAVWEASDEAHYAGWTPPVYIVVCNNTTTSKLVYDYIAGYEESRRDARTVLRSGALPLFSNLVDGNWRARPVTILVDSAQLESGEAMSDEFKKLAQTEIEEFKNEYRIRFPGRDIEALTDEDLLREVMNTVGKPGRLGEHVRCVVSVSMLTEGWDANTVTHVLGVRAFGTQLLCEQVVGRALRRRSHVTDDEDHFTPEYAEVYGVPFSFIPTAGATEEPKILPPPTHVQALPERAAEAEITFPRVVGYRYELAPDLIEANFKGESDLVLSPKDVPTETESAGIIGETAIHALDDLRRIREQEVAFRLAKRLLERKFVDSGVGGPPVEEVYIFPQLLQIVRRYIEQKVRSKDDAFVQMLLIQHFADDACDRIYRAIVRHQTDTPEVIGVRPTLHPFEPTGSTNHVSFDTRRPTYRTREKCHVSHVVCDTNSWEQKLARSLEEMEEVRAYVKNEHLGFSIPYVIDGEEHSYLPDFLVRIDDGHGEEELLNLIVEVSGAGRRDKAAKVATVRTMWLPAVNQTGVFGRWEYVEIRDPWDAKTLIRKHLASDRRSAVKVAS